MNELVIASAEQLANSEGWDPYAILGIKRRSSPEKIRAAYRRQAKKLHTDAGGDAKAFLLLKEAHDFLMDTVARALWDRKQIRASELECKVARELLDNICAQVVDGIAAGGQIPPEHANIVDLMRQVICSQLDDFAGDLSKGKNRLRRLKLMSGRTQRKGRGDNLVARVLDGKIAQAEVAIEAISREIRVGDVMLAELEVYECDVADVPPTTNFHRGDARSFTFNISFA